MRRKAKKLKTTPLQVSSLTGGEMLLCADLLDQTKQDPGTFDWLLFELSDYILAGLRSKPKKFSMATTRSLSECQVLSLEKLMEIESTQGRPAGKWHEEVASINGCIAQWRRAVHGPNVVDLIDQHYAGKLINLVEESVWGRKNKKLTQELAWDSKKKEIHAKIGRDNGFDTYVFERELGHGRLRLPNIVLERGEHSRKKTYPQLHTIVAIETFADLFDWFLFRAIVNSQLSCFFHCVVCDRWLLKEISGQRSGRILNLLAENWHLQPNAWPELLLSMPVWPAKCSDARCKTEFENATGEGNQNGFVPERFRGLAPWHGFKFGKNYLSEY